MLARRVFGETAAGLAALLCASSPALRDYVGTLQYEVRHRRAACSRCWSLAVCRTIDASSPDRACLRRAAFTGVAGALLILTRETFAVIVPLVALWIGDRVAPSSARRRASQRALARRDRSHGAGDRLVGGAVDPPRRLDHDLGERADRRRAREQSARANGTYNAPLVGIGQPTGLAFVATYPGRTVVLAGRKILYFWGVLRDGWNVPRASAVWAVAGIDRG